MKQAEQRMKTRWILVFLAMLVCFCGWWAVRKEGFFADELYSYGLSNSDYAPFLSWYYNGERAYSGTSAEHIYSREDFMSYVAVQEGQRFDYASVYYNQTQDVHPPVFYFLLHTVCSLFPGSFTKWTGLGLNFALFGGTIAALYALGMEIFEGENSWKKSLFVCALYAFSGEAISNATMIRMYMLLTLFTTVLALLLAKALRRPTLVRYLLIGIVIYLGMLTQYFYVIYAFLLCAVYDFYLMLRREWKHVVQFSAAALAGVGGMMLTFPCWLAQLHSQSTVSLDTTTDNILNLSQYPKGPLELTGWSIVEFGVGAGIMALLLLVALTKRFLPGKLRQTVLIAPRAKLITIPALAAFIVIAVISPYKSLRYVYHLQPLEALFCGCGFFAVLDTLGQNARKKITQAVCALMLVLAFVLTPERMYIGNRKVNEELEQYSDAQCVSLIGDMTAFTSELPEYLHFKEICAVQDTSSTLLREYCTGESDSMVVFICGRGLWQFVTPGEVEQITQENQASAEEIARLGGYTSVEMLDTQEFSQIWVLKK